MRKRWTALLASALGVALVAAPALGQGYNPGYGGSTLVQDPSAVYGQGQTQGYEAYWNNYLDQLQQQGGYVSYTGNYPNSMPVTSYYPATPGDASAQAQGQAAAQPSMYDTSAQQTYGSTGQAYQQQPAAQQYQQYQQYQAPTQATGTTKKKRRLSMKRHKAEQAQQEAQQAYEQQQQAYQQQQYQQQQAAYQQQQQAYQQQQQYQQQAAQQQGYPQQAQAYQQQAAQEQPQQASSVAYSGDPIVQEAQRKAYERAVARQRAAELAAQQQAAAQELQQTQRMYEQAQQRLQQQEARQQALRDEYRKKAAADAYENLRAAQRRYYDLMGVSGQSGPPAQAQGPTQPQQFAQQPQQFAQQPQQFAQQPQQYAAQQPQPQATTAYNQGGQGGYPVTPSAAQAPTAQPTPLRVQGQQQESGGGFWSALKEIFSPSQNIVPPSQSRFGGQKSNDLMGD